MNKNDLTKASRFLSLVLRHKPDAAGITVDKCGWADVHELIKGMNEYYGPFTRTDLETIVETDDKQRYSFDKYKKKIRANQGHSFEVDLGLEEQEPPKILYHGTAMKYMDGINKEGLISKSRQHVHLSNNSYTAYKVGERHGKDSVVICIVHAERMYKDGYKFYCSENGVWLTDAVPRQYLTHFGVDNSTDALTAFNNIVKEYYS